MVSFKMNTSQMRHIYTSVPEIRILVNSWYDGPPKDLVLFRGRHMLRRLVIRAIRELLYDGQFIEYYLEGDNAYVLTSTGAKVKHPCVS